MPNPNKLKFMLHKKGVTQRELAKALGTDESNISHMCNHHVNSTEKTLKKIAAFLDCEVTEII